MNDPFELLRDQLVSAASRAPVAATERRRPRWLRWLDWRSRPLAVVLAALVVTGSAAAAVATLTGSPSQPLLGKVPGRIEPASLAGYRYTITVTPNLDAGSAFWNTAISYTNGRGGGGGSGGGSEYATARNPLFGADDNITSTNIDFRGDTVGYVLTRGDVTAVRIGGRTIRTTTSPGVPVGDRVAVFFLPAGSPSLMFGWRPGEPLRSSIRFPPFPGHKGPSTIQTIAVLPLDRFGNVIASHQTYPVSSFYYFWQAPAAVTPNISEPPYHGPTHPGRGVCELADSGLPGLIPAWGDTIRVIARARDSVGELFVSCVSTEYYLHGWPLEAGVLLDARQPGRVLGPIPGATPVPGQPDVVDFRGGSLTARRIGNAWLAVKGGSGLEQRLQVLRALRVSKLDLSHLS
jgi:hypothetical protein